MNTQKGFISLGLLITIILGVVVVGGGAYYVMNQSPQPQAPIYQDQTNTQSATQATTNTTSSPQNNGTPTITITNIAGHTITVKYSGLSVTQEGATSPSSLWVQNEGWSKPTLEVAMDGVPSGKMTFTLPANAPAGNYGITPVGIPTKPYAGGVGPGYMAYGETNAIVSASFYLSPTGSITIGKGSASASGIQPAENSGPALSTYTNSQYGYSIQYPSVLTPNTASGFAVKIETPNTNEGPNSIGVSVNSNMQNCLTVPSDPTGERGIKDYGNVQINSVPFRSYSWGNASTGHFMSVTSYAAIYNSMCYSIQVTANSLAVSRLQGDEVTKAQAALDYLSKTSDSIVYSFRFTH